MNLSKQSCVVFDHGVFIEVALRLARDIGKVYYCCPWESAYSKIDQAAIGDGFDEIERVSEIWEVIEKVDFAVFPDVHHAAMQRLIESRLQVPVWGARRADELELRKASFRAIQRQLGMELPEYEVVRGLSNLRVKLKDKESRDSWIKISPQFRGNRETFHHVDYRRSRPILDQLAVEFGPLQETLNFLVEKSIKAKLEGGIDTYTVDGWHPSVAVQGYEKKDKGYFAVVQDWEDLPEELTVINDFLWDELKARRCRQMLSTEVKITEDGRSILLEPTVRFPSPAGEEQMELYDNFSTIIAAGASGEGVEPELNGRFACEAMVEPTGPKDRWKELRVPDSVRRWIKLYGTTKIGDTLAIAPGYECLGAVVGIGDSPTEALDHLKENASALKDEPVEIHIAALAEILQEIEEAERAGVHFTSQSMPKPAEAVEGD